MSKTFKIFNIYIDVEFYTSIYKGFSYFEFNISPCFKITRENSYIDIDIAFLIFAVGITIRKEIKE